MLWATLIGSKIERSPKWSNQTQLSYFCLNYRRRDSFLLLKLNLMPRDARGHTVTTKRKAKPRDRRVNPNHNS